MINYLRSVIGDMMEKQNPEINQPTEIDNDTILEYAGIIQELDDLTEKGVLSKYATDRAPIDIPLDSDIEIESIEFNMTDGRVTDIPSDATVQEEAQTECDQIDQKYAGMKTRDDFIRESYSYVPRRERESDSRYEDRVYEYAMRKWNEYNQQLFQEGVHGHGKLSVNDISVPDKIHLNFGAGDSSNDYAVTLPIRWQVDNKNRVTKKQLDSVQVWSKFGSYGLEKMTGEIFKHLGDKYNIPGNKKKWDVMTPTDVIVPIEPSDEYCIAVGFDTEYSKDVSYYKFSLPVKALKIKEKKDIAIPDNAMGRIAPIQTSSIRAIRKRDYKLEQAAYVRRGRFDYEYLYQEAIDFGDGGGDDAAGGDMPPTGGDVSNAAPSTIDAAADVDQAAPPTPDAQPAANAADANVNDVSDQIAQNVENVTAQQENEDAGDTDIPEDDTSMETEDIDINDTPDTTDVDAEIDSLDDMGNTDASVDDTPDDVGNTPDDLDDMTIDELISQGAEKLKGMTINQLKAFIAAPDGTTPTEAQTESFHHSTNSERLVSEGFFTNASNIKKRLRVAIEDVLSGLVKIYKGCSSGKWDRFKLRKFWSAVRTYESDEPDEEEMWDDDNWGASEGVYKGNQFRSYVTDLLHYLKMAPKKKSKEAFSKEDLDVINRSKNSLIQFHDLCDRASSKFKIKNDISMKEVAQKARFALANVVELKKLLTEEPMFANEFCESYVQETFITKKNIRSEMSKHIKSSLAILNDTELSYRQLTVRFREEEKALSRILLKASKMNGVFSTREINEIKELQESLSRVASNMRINALNDTETERIKRSIMEYVMKCKEVSEYVLPDNLQSSVQEGCPVCDQGPDTVKEEDTDMPNDVPADARMSQDDVSTPGGAPVDNTPTQSLDTTPPPTSDTSGPEPANNTSNVGVGTECGDNNQEPVPVTESMRNYTPIRWNDTKKLKDKGLISRFEQTTNFAFPKEFKSVVTESNGGTPSKRAFRTNRGERAIKTFLSFNRSDVNNVWSEYDWNKEKLDGKYIPFAVDIHNNPICFNKKDKSVVLVTESAVESAGKSFSRFMTSLFMK